MKFKFKKRVLKLEISTFKNLPHFLNLYEFDNFYIKLRAEKDRKFSTIYRESLMKLSLQNFFLNIPIFDF